MKHILKTIFCLLAVCCVQAWAAGAGHAEALLWSISKNGEPAGYLAGTLHAGKDERLPEGLQTAVGDSRTLVVETLSVDPEYYQQRPEKMPEFLAAIVAEKSLAEGLGREKAERLHQLLAESPLTAAMAPLFAPDNRIGLWFAALMTGYTGLPQDYLGAYGADGLLLKRAKRAGKAVYGLEDDVQTMRLLSALPDSAAVAMIDFALEHREKISANGKKMVEAYGRGDAAALWQIYLDGWQDDLLMPPSERAAVRHFIDRILLAQRNRNWLPEINRRLAEGRPLIAVGALHLLGSDGLVRLLREQGWTLEPVKWQ
ncbi:MAG: TraB/GumN family protein [Neisseria sp.]|nr:TraB/GumN family protein [Neisseria sp.]